MNKLLNLIMGPLIFVIILLISPPEDMPINAWRVIACSILMIIWWINGAVPVAATSLLPIVLFPILGISSAKEASAPYASPVVFLFLGGFLLGAAVEKWGLHKRIALNILTKIGTNMNGVVLGFVISSGFISMWMSNTATVVMMMPIAISVIELLNNSHANEKSYRNFAAALLISIAYSASIGGMATVIGTPSNGIFVAFMKENFGLEVTFVDWLIVAFPFSFVLLMFCFIILVKVVFPIDKTKTDIKIYRLELQKIGKISLEEKLLIIIFTITVILWVFNPILQKMFKNSHICDSVIAMLAAISLFIIPTNIKEQKFLLDWNKAKNIPWDVLFLFGGGLSLAASLQYSGVIGFFEAKIANSAKLDVMILILAVSVILSIATTFIGNAALTGMALPVVSSLAVGLEINPLVIAMVATFVSSCAFMLPMSTPPNAVIYASPHVRMIDLIKAGFIMNIAAIIVILIMIYPLVEYSFNIDLSIFPEWAKAKIK